VNRSEIFLLSGLCTFGALLLVLNDLYKRRQAARGMRRAQQDVERLHREEDAGIPPSPADYQYAISFDAEGVTVSSLRGQADECASIRWEEVSRATAFKRDYWSTDCICLFLARSDDSGIELNEEMGRWRSLLAALPERLPGCRSSDEWLVSVALPPFEPKPTEIYSRVAHQPA